MELSVSHSFPSVRNSEAFQVFTKRLARLMFLKQICEADHPVLSTERSLVEMAKTRLQEYVFIHISNDKIKMYRPLIETWVRAVTLERVMNYNEEDSIKESVMRSIQIENLSDLIPFVH